MEQPEGTDSSKCKNRSWLDETGWVKILDWGYTAEVYGRGNDRVIIDRKTGRGRVIIRYKVLNG